MIDVVTNTLDRTVRFTLQDGVEYITGPGQGICGKDYPQAARALAKIIELDGCEMTPYRLEDRYGS